MEVYGLGENELRQLGENMEGIFKEFQRNNAKLKVQIEICQFFAIYFNLDTKDIRY